MFSPGTQEFLKWHSLVSSTQNIEERDIDEEMDHRAALKRERGKNTEMESSESENDRKKKKTRRKTVKKTIISTSTR